MRTPTPEPTRPDHRHTPRPTSSPAPRHTTRHRASGRSRTSLLRALRRLRLSRITPVALATALLAGGTLALTGSAPVSATTMQATAPGQLVVDGHPTVMLVHTDRSLVDQVRDRYAGSRVQVSRSGDRTLLAVHTPATITVTADGSTSVLTTTQATASGALAEARIAVGDTDEVTTTPAHPGTGNADATGHLRDGDSVTVVRVRDQVDTLIKPVPARTVQRPTADLPTGQQHLLRPGRPGTRVVQVRTETRDGQVTSVQRTVIATTPSRARIIQVGTGPVTDHPPRPAPRASTSTVTPTTTPTTKPATTSTFGKVTIPAAVRALNWSALAACESSGNPAAVNPAGYYGLYQFNLGTWGTVGGTGNPARASAAEQTYRAQVLYLSRGASPWPVCGKRL